MLLVKNKYLTTFCPYNNCFFFVVVVVYRSCCPKRPFLYLVMSSCMAALGGVLFGYDIGMYSVLVKVLFTILHVMAQWLLRRTWGLKVESLSPDQCTRVVFLGKTLPLSTQVYKWEPANCLGTCRQNDGR